MRGKVITHKDGTQSITIGDIDIVKGGEAKKDQKVKDVNINKNEVADIEKGKAKLKSNK